MNVPEINIAIVEDNGCPLYDKGDQFVLNGRSLELPTGKPACMVLVEDIKGAIEFCETLDGDYIENCPVYGFSCSGPQTHCTGMISLESKLEAPRNTPPADQEKAEKIRAVLSMLASFPIFKGLSDRDLRNLGGMLKFKQFNPGETVITRGDLGVHLHIIASGRVSVIGEDGMRITELGKGEVFGEMSLISGGPVGATVEVMEPTKVLFIKGKDFGKILNRYPSLQMYFARLLATRLADTTQAMSAELASGMTGKLSEIPPAELFQTLNANQKTGAVDLSLSGGEARVCFRDGELVGAEYGDRTGIEAFFEILRETGGRFKFSSVLLGREGEEPVLGDFMFLLMEGIRKIDEDDSSRTEGGA